MKRMKMILFIISIILIFFTISCIKNKEQLSRPKTQKNNAVTVSDTKVLSEEDEAFYRQLKKKLEKAQIYAYESPADTPSLDFTLEDLEGKEVSLFDYRGQTVLLNFWATWCGPCRSEMPSMEALYNDMKDKGFVLLSVNLKERRDSVAAYVKKAKLSFPVLLDTTGEIGSTYGAQSIPLSYFIDTKGFVVGGVLGAKEWNTDSIKEIITFIQDRE